MCIRDRYESLILPMQKYLEEAGVEFQFNTEVTNVLFEFEGNKKIAKAIECKAVSYTHLDVYKRQEECTGRLKIYEDFISGMQCKIYSF